MPTIWGVNFGREFFFGGGGGPKPWSNKAEKFRGKFAVKFAENSRNICQT